MAGYCRRTAPRGIGALNHDALSGEGMTDSEPGADIHETIVRTRVATDLMIRLRGSTDEKQLYRIIVEFNAGFPGGEAAARALLLMRLLGLTEYSYADVMRPSWLAVSPLLEGMRLVEPIVTIEMGRI